MVKLMFWIVLITLAGGVQAGRSAEPLAEPVVESVYPDHGKAGDLVTITGRGFSVDREDVHVTIGGVAVDVVQVKATQAGRQALTVRLNKDTISGLVSVGAGDQLATHAGTFCTEPSITALSPTYGRDGTIVQIWGTNFGHSAIVFVGQTPFRPQRTKSIRRPHIIDADRLLIFIEGDVQGPVRVENHCPDGRSFSDTADAPFRFLVRT